MDERGMHACIALAARSDQGGAARRVEWRVQPGRTPTAGDIIVFSDISMTQAFLLLEEPDEHRKAPLLWKMLRRKRTRMALYGTRAGMAPVFLLPLDGGWPHCAYDFEIEHDFYGRLTARFFAEQLVSCWIARTASVVGRIDAEVLKYVCALPHGAYDGDYQLWSCSLEHRRILKDLAGIYERIRISQRLQ